MTFLILWNCPGGGGGAQLVPSRVSTVWTEETMAGDTPGRECPHDDFGMRPQMGTKKMSDDRVPDSNIELRIGEGRRPSPVLPGALFRWTFQLCMYYLLMDLSWVPGRLQSCGSTRPLRGTLLDGNVLMLSRIGDGRATCLNGTAVLDRCVWGRC